MVTANIMIPNGKLKVTEGKTYAIMTGLFIVEKLDCDAMNVTWNHYGCAPALITKKIFERESTIHADVVKNSPEPF